MLELLKYWIVLLIPIYKLKLCHHTELSSRQHEALSNDMFSCLFWKTRNVFFIHSRKHISLCAIGQHNIKFVHSQRISDRKSESFRSVTMWCSLTVCWVWYYRKHIKNLPSSAWIYRSYTISHDIRSRQIWEGTCARIYVRFYYLIVVAFHIVFKIWIHNFWVLF